MTNLSRHFQPQNILILLGVTLLVIGFYGYAQFSNNLMACSPEPPIWDFHFTEVTFQSIGLTDGCFSSGGPSYALLGPVGSIVILLGGGAKAIWLLSQGNLARAIGTLLIGVGLVIGSIFTLLSRVIWTGVSLVFLVVGSLLVVITKINN